MTPLEKIYNQLGINKSNGLFFTQEGIWKRELNFPNRVVRLIETIICPDAFFCVDNKPMILFYNNPSNKSLLHKQIWNFNESAIVIIVEDSNINIYNGFRYDDKLKSLSGFGNNVNLSDFSYFEIVTGKTWDKYSKDVIYSNRVDYCLLENVKEAQRQLIAEHSLPVKTANALIGKCIFVRYLIDREVLLNTQQFGITWNREGFNGLLANSGKTKAFFNYLAEKFNGDDLFPISDAEYTRVTDEALGILIHLLRGDTLKSGQRSLFDLYDFSVIPTEFISNIYESFIGEDNQADNGAYYTPLFLVDYILHETVETYLDAHNKIECKILDPACGSGVFLVESLRKLIDRYLLCNPSADQDSASFKKTIKDIATKNIWGIDKDEKAILVAIFSIYITLLDYQSPADIETFEFPKLLDKNFFIADFFDMNADYNKIIKSLDIHFIVGNPPWNGSKKKEIDNYIQVRKRAEKGKVVLPHVNNGEIAEAFVLRTSDFSCSHTKCAFIVRSCIFYNKGYKDGSQFRQYLCEEYYVDKVFELAPVRKELFDKSNGHAIAPATLFFYRYAHGENTNNNILTHITLKPSRFFSIFKVLTVYHSDFKKIRQVMLKEHDWLWKTLVYGSYLDFNFIKKLKSRFRPISVVLEENDNIVYGTGIQFSSNPNYDAQHLMGKNFITSDGIGGFFINPDKIIPFDTPKVHRLRDPKLFKTPLLLTLKGADMSDLTIRSAFMGSDNLDTLLYKDTVTGVSGDETILRTIQSILSSAMCSYLAIYTFESIGIEREQIMSDERFSLPYIDSTAKELCARIENINNEIYSSKKQCYDFLQSDSDIITKEQQRESLIKQLNSIIINTICDNQQEKALIDYALDVIRPFILPQRHAERIKLLSEIKYQSDILNNYASIYLERFNSLTGDDKKFIVRIRYSLQLILMQFEMHDKASDGSDIIWENMEPSDIVNIIINVSNERITDKLVIQKDVRGFEREYFYIAKPNEYRLWHEAIAYQDVQEFVDAIMFAGKKDDDL